MRPAFYLSVVLGLLASLLVAVPAQAEIKPIPKPEKVVAKTSAKATHVAPIVKPAVRAKPAVRTKPVVRKKHVVHKKAAVHKKAVVHKRAVVHKKTAVHAKRVVHPARSTARHVRAATHVRRHWMGLSARHGGRYVPPAASWGGRRAPPPPLPVKPRVPDPTPLGLVGLREALPAPVPAWPAWVFSVLGALAVGEAVVVFQLVRGRRLSPSL